MWQVEAPVHCRDEVNLTSKQQWHVNPVGMAMNHVEGLCPVSNRVKKPGVSGPWVRRWATEPQGTRTSGDEVGTGAGIAAGKQSDVTAETHQLFGKPGDHPLGAAIEFRGYAFRQRRYFRNAHLLQLRRPNRGPEFSTDPGEVSSGLQYVTAYGRRSSRLSFLRRERDFFIGIDYMERPGQLPDASRHHVKPWMASGVGRH
jgi:hypothetical protein